MSISKQIDEICDRFEAAWKAGEEPSLKEALKSIAEEGRSALGKELIPLDVECRARHSTMPVASDYAPFGAGGVKLAQKAIEAERPAEENLPAQDTGYDETLIGSDAAPESSGADDDAMEKSRQIGPYKLLQQIGEGGMGSVFMAEQTEPVKRRVALKVIKTDAPSKEILTRFDAERQAVAMMNHPNIAKVLDAGITEDGRPYFAMELVQGVSITEYCDENKLSPNERLDLFVQTCRAVQHAHTKGIVHRDLKPGNVLVTQTDGKPVAKVIDFGLAKALQDTNQLTENTLFTQYGQVVGTLAYMSPEQAEMNTLDVDTRTDVYSLGVILYELLTGSTPITRERLRDVAFDRILALIREEEATRPSARLSESGDAITGISEQRKTLPKRLSLILKGDLDWIAMKALEKDRSRRYDGASSLADDVQRYLNNEAIEAHPPSLSYRLRKAYLSNKAAFWSGAVMVALLIAGAIGTGTMWLYAVEEAGNAVVEANRARAAETEATTAKGKVTDLLVSTYTSYGLFAGKAKQNGDALLWFSKAASLSRNEAERNANNLRFDNWADRSLIPVNAFSISRDASTLVDGGRPKDGQPVKLTRPGKPTGVSFHPAETHVLISTNRGTILWDLQTDARQWFPGGRCSWSQDGEYFAISEVDGTISIWDFDEGKQLKQFHVSVRPGSVLAPAIAFSSDGKVLAAGQAAIRLCNLAEMEPGQEFGIDAGVIDLSFDDSGAFLVAATADKKVSAFNVSSESSIELSFQPVNHRPAGWDGGVGMRMFPPLHIRGSKILCADIGNRLQVVDLATGRKEITMGSAGAIIANASVSKDGRIVAAAFERNVDSWVVTFDTASGRELSTVDSNLRIPGVSLSATGETLATGAYDSTLNLWDTKSGTLVAGPSVHQGDLGIVCLAPSGRYCATIQPDGLARVFLLKAPPLRTTEPVGLQFTLEPESVGDITITPGARWRRPSRSINVYHVPDGQKIYQEIQLDAFLTASSLSEDGEIIAAMTTRDTPRFNDRLGNSSQYGLYPVIPGALSFWRAKTGESVSSVDIPSIPLSGAFLSSTKFVACCGDGSVVCADLKTGEVSVSKETVAAKVTASGYDLPRRMLRVGPGNKQFLTCGYRNRLRVFSDDLILQSWFDCPAPVRDACFSSDGKHIAVSCTGGTVGVWSAATGELVSTILKLPDNATSCNFGVSDSLIAASCKDSMVRVWDWQNDKLVCPGLKHENQAFSAQFWRDSHYLITAADHEIRFWDTQTGLEIAPMMTMECKEPSLTISTDGQSAVFCGARATGTPVSLGLVPSLPFDQHEKSKTLDRQLLASLASSKTVLENGTDLLDSESWYSTWKTHSASRPPKVIDATDMAAEARPGVRSSTPLEIAARVAARAHALIESSQDSADKSPLPPSRARPAPPAENAPAPAPEIQTVARGVSPSEFQIAASFESNSLAHWQTTSWRNLPGQVSLSTKVKHGGTSALQIQVDDEANTVMVFQTVSVEPSTTYRFAGWILADSVVVNPEELRKTGVCLGIAGRMDSSESILGTSDWKHVSWDFTTGDDSTIKLGCRFGHQNSSCTGTAWFDNLTLEKID